jgi:CheY-like chemotaxis protein
MAKILLVEDDNNLREIYEARLQAEGYKIISAHDGEEALVIAKNEIPDLIISDVMMPKISGFEMLDILRNTDGLKEVKVIMLTALGQSEDEQRADKLGADRYLVKSQVTLEDIVKAASELLDDNFDVDQATSADADNNVQTELAPTGSDVDLTSAAMPTSSAATFSPQTPLSNDNNDSVTPQNSDVDDTQTVSTEPRIITNSETLTSNQTVDSNESSNDQIMTEAVTNLINNQEPESEVQASNDQPTTSNTDTSIEPDLTLPLVDPADPNSNVNIESVAEETKEVEEQIENFANSNIDVPEPVNPVINPDTLKEEPSNENEQPAQQLTTPAVTPPPSLPVLDPPQISNNASSGSDTAVTEDLPATPAKKVINPITPVEQKPDINQLLANEEAKETQTATTPDSSTVTTAATVQKASNDTSSSAESVANSGPAVEQLPPSSKTTDINSIAL